MGDDSAAVVETEVDGCPLSVAVLCDGRWRVTYRRAATSGRSLIPLLEQALGRHHPELVKHALDALEASKPADAARARDER